VALRYLCRSTRSPGDAASMDNLCIVVYRLTVYHKHKFTAAMPSFAQDSSVVVGTDFVVLRRSAGACFDTQTPLADCDSNQAIGIR
jgi:hypothetical protein